MKRSTTTIAAVTSAAAMLVLGAGAYAFAAPDDPPAACAEAVALTETMIDQQAHIQAVRGAYSAARYMGDEETMVKLLPRAEQAMRDYERSITMFRAAAEDC